MNDCAIRECLMPHDDEIMTEIPIDPFREAAVGHECHRASFEGFCPRLNEIEKLIA